MGDFPRRPFVTQQQPIPGATEAMKIRSADLGAEPLRVPRRIVAASLS